MTTHHVHTKTALVTGGSRGLGRSTALHLAQSGVDVVLTYRANAEEAEAVVAEIEKLGRRAVALQLDTTRLDTFADFGETFRTTLRDTFGRDDFDILINNAGAVAWTPLGEIEESDMAHLVGVHFTGVVMLTQELVGSIVDGGRIVNTSTGLARFVGQGGYSVYASVKGAIEVWTRYLAKDLGPRRIAVNAIAPGATGTDFGGGSMRDDEQVRTGLSSVIAMGRVGEPDDIGAAVAAISSDAMGWVTGQRIEASGGMLL